MDSTFDGCPSLKRLLAPPPPGGPDRQQRHLTLTVLPALFGSFDPQSKPASANVGLLSLVDVIGNTGQRSTPGLIIWTGVKGC